ncbi:MAG: hypothetical protein JO053_09720 [Acidobacteria bacterium]|nr:hypothetical protein [Acidobacteriota bacterium]
MTNYQNKFAMLSALAALIVVGLACGKSTPPPAAYVGTWTGSDGTTITIRADGSGDYKSGNSNVTNGNVTVDEGAKTLKITLAGLGPSYNIDKAPAGDSMTLSGVVFKKGGGSSTTSSAPSSNSSNSASSNANANKKDDDDDEH